MECREVNSLRDRISALWNGDRLTKKEWTLGTYNGPDAEAKNYIAMELNRYVQITNWKDEALSLNKFKSRLRAIEDTERRIAMKKHKSHIHDSKWNAVLQHLN